MANRGINKAIIMGNLGRNPETRYTSNGSAMVNITIATSETWKDQSGEIQEKTEWHKVIFYRKLAEIVQKYAKKGCKLYVEGKIQTRKWQDNEGKERYTTEIIGNEIHLLDSKSSPNTSSGNSSGNSYNKPNSSKSGNDFKKNTEETNESDSWEHTDIPF